MGYAVDGVTLENVKSDNPNCKYICGNAKGRDFKEVYLDIISEGAYWAKYQLIYARMFQRITDNTKILEHTGMKQSEFMTLKDGLFCEYEHSKDMDWKRFAEDYRNTRMDSYLGELK